MTRALVLGGGGPVGIGWQAGLIVGMAEAGVDLGQADQVVGTSAGSVVGAQLAAGADLTRAVALLAGPAESGASATNDEGMARLMAMILDAVTAGDVQGDAVRARLGQAALEAPTEPEAEFVARFQFLEAGGWPDGFSCTAVDAVNGAFRVWDQSSGVGIAAAVASSCAVPMVYPPVTVGGRRYLDGGMRDILNPDVATGADVVIAVSCTLLELPEGLADPALEAMFAVTAGHLATLRASGAEVAVITPGAEFLEISGWGTRLMDFGQAAAAYAAGTRQGASEAERLSAFWRAATP